MSAGADLPALSGRAKIRVALKIAFRHAHDVTWIYLYAG
jgi:hypothetical protein